MNPAPYKYSMYYVYLLKIERTYTQLKNRITTDLKKIEPRTFCTVLKPKRIDSKGARLK